MNVIISNQQDNIINNLDIEIIKSLHGEFDVEELVSSFANFFFSRMILDVTALKDYEDVINYQKISIGLPVDKIILLIPAQTVVATNQFLSKLISMGFYNFTTNKEGLEYLMQHPNSYKDVAHIHQINEPVMAAGMGNNVCGDDPLMNHKCILGIKNITEHAGATTLTYMLFKELNDNQGIDALALEVNKRDFSYFKEEKMQSVNKNELSNVLLKNQQYSVILVDLNDADPSICTDCLYLVEPSIIKMNKLMMKDRMIFTRLKGSKIMLNKTFIPGKDIRTFESEAGLKTFFVMNSINDRERNKQIIDLLIKLCLIRNK